MRALASALLLLLLLPSCGGHEADVPKVLLWHSYRGDERAGIDRVVSEFNAANRDLQIEALAVPSKAYKSRLMSAIPRGNGPDLFIEAHELIGEWSNGKLLAPVAFPPGAPKGAFVDAAVQGVQFGGRSWGVPLAVKSPALFYNRALVPTPPATLEELVAVGRAVGSVPLAYESGELYHHAGLLHAFGGRVLGEDGRPALDTEGVRASMAYARSLVEDGVVPAEADGALVATLFNQGETAFVWNGPWFIGEIKDSIDFGVAPLPSAQGRILRPFLTVETLFHAAQGAAPQASVDRVIEAIAGKDGAVVRATVGRQVPAHKQALQDPAVASDAVLSAFARQAESTVPMPNRPEMSVLWEPANRGLRAVLRGAMSPAEAMERAQREAEAFLKPPPAPANPLPYLLLLGFLVLGGAVSLVQVARRERVWPRMKAGRAAYAYLGPAFIGMTTVVFVPFVTGAMVSLFAHKDGEFTLVGLANFWKILTSADVGITDPMSFWFTLVVTVAWTLANVVLHASIGLGLALLLRDPWMKLKGVYRVLLIVPWAVPNYITALIWRGMFNEQFGAINGVLGLFGVQPVAWFSSFFTSFAANVATNTWLGFPFMMVVTLGALQAIPRDLEEAAECDGAGAWLRFRHVTLPLLRPALLPAIILGSVWTFNMFNIIYLVSAGEPDGGTEILISEAYKWAFTRQAQYGYASAYAMLVFGILWMYTQITRRVTGGDVA